jgi:hypothetical protein
VDGVEFFSKRKVCFMFVCFQKPCLCGHAALNPDFYGRELYRFVFLVNIGRYSWYRIAFITIPIKLGQCCTI